MAGVTLDSQVRSSIGEGRNLFDGDSDGSLLRDCLVHRQAQGPAHVLAVEGVRVFRVL